MQWKAVADKVYFAVLSDDHATVLRFTRPLADCGVAEAQVILGVTYSEGRGVRQDHAEASRWFQRAAKQGDAGGQYWIGEMYYLGVGVSQNYAEALRWFPARRRPRERICSG